MSRASDDGLSSVVAAFFASFCVILVAGATLAQGGDTPRSPDETLRSPDELSSELPSAPGGAPAASADPADDTPPALLDDDAPAEREPKRPAAQAREREATPSARRCR